MKKYFLLFTLLSVFFIACNNSPQQATQVSQPKIEDPLALSYDAVMYEVNVRKCGAARGRLA